jgi:2-amino-4-hydroxy-6-hydroxymethyldihydropteridine diphosphokinase
MPEVYVAAGSNIAPIENLRRAVSLLRARHPDLRCSTAYRNRAVGFEGEDFVNLVIGFEASEPIEAVLRELHAVEAACGRERTAPKWAPRSMDLDVLLYGDYICNRSGLVLPRPDLLKRAYMLGPLAEIAPNFVHPTEGKTIAELWQAFDRAAHAMTPVPL